MRNAFTVLYARKVHKNILIGKKLQVLQSFKFAEYIQGNKFLNGSDSPIVRHYGRLTVHVNSAPAGGVNEPTLAPPLFKLAAKKNLKLLPPVMVTNEIKQ